jgi:hypothetical protein
MNENNYYYQTKGATAAERSEPELLSLLHDSEYDQKVKRRVD